MDKTSETSRRGRAPRWPLYAALLALYLLHNDLWLWDDARLVLGLPVGLLYHVVYCLVASLVLALLVKWAWPDFGGSDAATRVPPDAAAEPEAGDPGR